MNSSEPIDPEEGRGWDASRTIEDSVVSDVLGALGL